MGSNTNATLVGSLFSTIVFGWVLRPCTRSCCLGTSTRRRGRAVEEAAMLADDRWI